MIEQRYVNVQQVTGTKRRKACTPKVIHTFWVVAAPQLTFVGGGDLIWSVPPSILAVVRLGVGSGSGELSLVSPFESNFH